MIRPKTLIKWSGSKRSQAREIIPYFPAEFNVYYEPFLGGGSILGFFNPKKAVAGDVDKPLIQLWKLIQDNPNSVIQEYKKNWNNLQTKGYRFFYEIRDRFNQERSPHHLLFLSRTCVNGLIRYNQKGEFNNSLHHTRKGINPETLGKIILDWSVQIKGHKFRETSYEITTKSAKAGDFIYLDPPYFNTKGRYQSSINYDDFLNYLRDLNKRKIKFALSYDGTRGEKSYIVEIPKDLYKRHVMMHSGNSTFNKIQNKKIEKVHESLYLNF